MKILKYTFEIPRIAIDGDELIELEPIKETYSFTLLFKGVGVYEKLTGSALLTDLAKLSASGDVSKNLDISLIKNLAKASYCKIEGDAFHQNLATAEEFAKTEAFNRIGLDTDFMVELLNMAMDCCITKGMANRGGNPTKK